MPARLRRGFRANHQTLAMVPASPNAATKGLTNFRPLLTQGTLLAERRVTLCDPEQYWVFSLRWRERRS
jgi:hypothetical protein